MLDITHIGNYLNRLSIFYVDKNYQISIRSKDGCKEVTTEFFFTSHEIGNEKVPVFIDESFQVTTTLLGTLP